MRGPRSASRRRSNGGRGDPAGLARRPRRALRRSTAHVPSLWNVLVDRPDGPTPGCRMPDAPDILDETEPSDASPIQRRGGGPPRRAPCGGPRPRAGLPAGRGRRRRRGAPLHVVSAAPTAPARTSRSRCRGRDRRRRRRAARRGRRHQVRRVRRQPAHAAGAAARPRSARALRPHDEHDARRRPRRADGRAGPPCRRSRLTIPEGYRITQIADRVQADLGCRRSGSPTGESGDLVPAAVPAEGTSTAEGFLFPKTFEFVKADVTATARSPTRCSSSSRRRRRTWTSSPARRPWATRRTRS